MKLTDSILDFLYQNAYKFSIQIGIDEKDIPSLMFTRKEVLAKPETIGRRNTPRYYGVFFEDINTVFINVKHFQTRKRMKETLVHELVHKRFPYLGHGHDFEKKVQDILKGKTFKPYKPVNKKENKEINKGGIE